MILRSDLNPLPEYFDRYILKCDDVDILTAIEKSITEINHTFIENCLALGDSTYAPGKWTVKEILQHLIDTERIFSYRALVFARNDNTLLAAYDENAYAAVSEANTRSIQELVNELIISHQSLLSMYRSFTSDMLNRKGLGFKGMYSVADIGFILPGHQRWHFQILSERYFPLL